MSSSGRGDGVDPLSAGTGLPTEASGAAEGVEQAAAPTSPEAADALGGVDANGQIASELAAGRIDAAEAQARLIDEVVREQLPADAPAEVVDRLRAELGEILAGDPNLARLLGR